jgi:N-acetylneuraminic acid mutarotase
MPEARYQVGVTALDGIIYVAGGVTGSASWVARPDIFAYDPRTDQWRTVGTLIRPVRAPALAAVGNRVYVVGGYLDNPWEPVADLQIFDPATGSVEAGPAMPTARGGAAAVGLDGKLHVIGGVVAFGNDPMGSESNTHEVFDPSTGTWSSRAAMPSPRWGHGAVTVDGKIYVFGGWAPGFEVYYPGNDSWTSFSSEVARADLAAAALRGKIYLIGGGEIQSGCCEVPTSLVDSFDPQSGSWTRATAMPTARMGHRAAVVGQAIYVIGGSTTGPYVSFSAVNERFTPE